jgi:hypothetical protein
MTRPFEVRLLEQAYLRKVLFAVEVLDAVTLARVSQGLEVVADGLRGSPIVNAGGMFVWLDEDFAPLRTLSVIPGLLPYERVDLPAGQVKRPLTTIELSPRVGYPFAPGITGLRGTLIEERVASGERPVPVSGAEVRLRWLDDDVDATWRDAPTVSRTDVHGDFAAILRLPPKDVPKLDAGALTVRVRVRRPDSNERGSDNLRLPQGRVADPSTFASGPDALIFAWDELQP